ncbi:MAG TPA: WD40 repeat domain-containing protein [Verrucomicrobiae bacterium]|nr:WD40 repeat domain-containing protein [Verrucomicrobiae bacterium]
MAEARVWDLANGKPNTGWITTENPALGLVFSPDGKAISVFGGGWLDASYVMSSHRIEVFEPLSGQRLFPALSHSGPVFAASFSLNNRHLAIASGDRTVNIWDARSGQIVHSSLKNAGIAVRLSFSPDGNWLAAMNHDTPMQLWNIRSATPLCPPLSHEGELSDFTFLNNGQRLTTLTLSGKICVWDLARIEPASPPLVSEHGNPWTAAVFSPSGGQVATVTGCGDVRVWDTCSGLTLGRLLMGPDRIIGGMINNSASWSHDGLSVAAPFKETVRIWDVVLSKERLNPLKHENIVIYTEFSPDGKRIATASADFTAQIWDANTGIPLCLPLRHSYYVQRIRFSPDGRRVVTASNDRTARVWDAFTGEAISPPMPSPGHVLHVAFSPDSRRIAMSDNEGTIYIREADTGQQVGSVMHHSTLVHHIQFSPDGRYLLSTSMDRTARVWDAQTGQPICPPLVHTGYVVSGDVSPDSQRVVTGSYDCTARIWDIQTGEPLGPPFKHEKQILHVSFSPDGNQIATSSLDDTAQVWHVPKLDWSTEEILAAAHLLTGSRLEDSERVEPLSRAELEAAWSAVSFRFQTLTNRSVFEKARWHHRRALINEMRHDWYAAEFHARRWLELQPENAEANAALARVLECRIPARSSAAESELIDLSDVYNASLAIPWHAGPPGNHLAELPRGIQTLAGTRFDIRGLIQVVSEPAVTAKYPKQIAGIRIGRKSSRLQFLHSIQGGVLPDGTKVGHYVVHYVSSRTEEIPIIYGRDARDWHELPEHPVEASDAVIAWRGNNPATKISGATCIRLFKKTWINPAPDIEITSLDFVADHADAAPFLVALTAE